MSDSQPIVIQLSSLSHGAEFTIPEQQPMKSILHMIGQNLSNHQQPMKSILHMIDNDNDNEIFFIAMKLHNVHSIYKTTHM